jgi:translin
LSEASELLGNLKKFSRKHPDLTYAGIVDAAFQEYTEAHVFLGLVEKDKFVSPDEIVVPSVSYVLGVADVVGELRRKVLDSIKVGDIDTSEKCLQHMEEIYGALTAMDDAYFLVSGLRRKCDVARSLIEITRGEVAIETRRKSLENAIKRLEKAVERKT